MKAAYRAIAPKLFLLTALVSFPWGPALAYEQPNIPAPKATRILTDEEFIQALAQWVKRQASELNSVNLSLSFGGDHYFGAYKLGAKFTVYVPVCSLGKDGGPKDGVLVRAQGITEPDLPGRRLSADLTDRLENWLLDHKLQYDDRRLEIREGNTVWSYNRSFVIPLGEDAEKTAIVIRELSKEVFQASPPFVLSQTP